MLSRNGSNHLISNKKLKELSKRVRHAYLKQENLDYLVGFAEKELRLKELRRLGLFNDDDVRFIALNLGYISAQHGKKERDSGRLFIGHPIDAAREFIDAYLEYYNKRQGRVDTEIKVADISTMLCHDIEEEENCSSVKIATHLENLVDLPFNNIENKDRFKRMVVPVVTMHVTALTRRDNFYQVWRDLILRGNKRLIAHKLCDGIANVKELEYPESPAVKFYNKEIKDRIKRFKPLKYPYRRALNILSTTSHRTVEKLKDLAHQYEKEKKLYPTPKIIYGVFKSFIIIDAANQYMKTYGEDAFLITLKQRLIDEALKKINNAMEHTQKYHCEGLSREYAITRDQERILKNPLSVIYEHDLKKLDKAANILPKKTLLSGKVLSDPLTIEKAMRYFEKDYKKRKTGAKLKVGDLIYLEKEFNEYKNTDGINRLTYERKNGRDHPFDNMTMPWLDSIIRGDKSVFEDMRRQNEVKYKLIKILGYNLQQYRNNHTITFDWAKKQNMKKAAEKSEELKKFFSYQTGGRAS
ncbi:hypothetical protein AYK26_02975 [Euryarchaeota archaeon SM23-78]|nr:MAG: hypothetical protein AYK26_02975 [Euryarchaeota archaeon SM23-78]MBW3000407.1 hypothetical protein [Candidatus Woesearchaeota archaeon]